MSWQACPICHGRGSVPVGFYDTGGTYGGSTTAIPSRPKCQACNGNGVLLDPSTPVGGAPYRVDWNRVTSSTYSGKGQFDPTRYRNATSSVLTTSVTA